MANLTWIQFCIQRLPKFACAVKQLGYRLSTQWRPGLPPSVAGRDAPCLPATWRQARDRRCAPDRARPWSRTRAGLTAGPRMLAGPWWYARRTYAPYLLHPDTRMAIFGCKRAYMQSTEAGRCRGPGYGLPCPPDTSYQPRHQRGGAPHDRTRAG